MRRPVVVKVCMLAVSAKTLLFIHGGERESESEGEGDWRDAHWHCAHISGCCGAPCHGQDSLPEGLPPESPLHTHAQTHAYTHTDSFTHKKHMHTHGVHLVMLPVCLVSTFG